MIGVIPENGGHYEPYEPIGGGQYEPIVTNPQTGGHTVNPPVSGNNPTTIITTTQPNGNTTQTTWQTQPTVTPEQASNNLLILAVLIGLYIFTR